MQAASVLVALIVSIPVRGPLVAGRVGCLVPDFHTRLSCRLVDRGLSLGGPAQRLPASIFIASRCFADAPVTTSDGLLKTVVAWVSSLCGMNRVAFSFNHRAVPYVPVLRTAR